jgi:hypothetical protein
MEPGQGEFSPFFLYPVRAGDGIHAQAAFQHQALAHLHPVLELLGQVSPAHYLQLGRGVVGPQAVHLHGHLRHRRLVVLGVAHLGRFEHLDFKQTVIHSQTTIGWKPS